jgi:hypothetical protein
MSDQAKPATIAKQSSGPFGPGTPYSEYEPRKLLRINERYKRIIESNLTQIVGKRILDLAAHDGRWTWAALTAGAAYVEAVEGRPELVQQANQALSEFPPERFTFLQGDIFSYLTENVRAKGDRFDTILCLGIFYHINEHFRLLQLMSNVAPSAIILDSALLSTEEPIIRFKVEKTDDPLNAIPGEVGNNHALVGTMSTGLLGRWAKLNGWDVEYIAWNRTDIAQPAPVRDYLAESDRFRDRRRYTCVLSKNGSGGPVR